MRSKENKKNVQYMMMRSICIHRAYFSLGSDKRATKDLLITEIKTLPLSYEDET
jgi:hypothetical protein